MTAFFLYLGQFFQKNKEGPKIQKFKKELPRPRFEPRTLGWQTDIIATRPQWMTIRVRYFLLYKIWL